MIKPKTFAVVVLAAATASASASAFPVVDASRVTEMGRHLLEVRNLLTQVTTAERLLRNSSTRIRSGELLRGNPLTSLQRLTSDVRIIGYRYETIARQYDRLFPDKQAVQNTSTEEMRMIAEGWDTELHGSALVAARAQNTAAELEQSARASEQLLAASGQAVEGDQGSQLAALQALVQMLGVLNDDLARLGSALAATERVNASEIARESAAERMSEERRRRSIESYGRKRHVPEVDARLLGASK